MAGILQYYNDYEKVNYKNKENALTLFNSLLLNPNEASSYLLGYLWADGWIRLHNGLPQSVGMEILDRDADYLIPIFEEMGVISVSRRQRENRQPQACISVNSRPLAEALHSLGLTKNRLNCKNLMEILPISLRRFFVLGLVDGDGCIYISKDSKVQQFYITACKEQSWEYLKEFILKECGVSLTTVIQDHYSCVRVTGKTNLTKLGSWVYQGHTLGLPRKRDKWIGLISTPTPNNHILTDEQSEFMMEQIRLGVPYRELSQKLGVSEKFISGLKMRGGYRKNEVTVFKGL